MRGYLSALAMVLATMSPVLAEGGAAQGNGSTVNSASADPDLDKVVCKKLGPPIGSHLGSQTVCQTKKKWLELERQSQDEIRRAQGNGALSNQPGG